MCTYSYITYSKHAYIMSCIWRVYVACMSWDWFTLTIGFEQELDGSDWYCHGNCEVNQDTDAHTGTYSGRVTGRYVTNITIT